MELLVQNTKMKKSSRDGIILVNWTIPAFQASDGFRTCPNAGVCAAGCYARSGAYVWGNVRQAHEAKLALTKTKDFTDLMITEIDRWLKRKIIKHLWVRIHDAGDFYSLEYLNKWLQVMDRFKDSPRVSFYAYSKQVQLFKQVKARLPDNFTVIFSYGGKQDAMIDAKHDRHSQVFETREELIKAGYADSTDDDLIAASGDNHRVGLCYHGAKAYSNTAWDRVGDRAKAA